MKLSKQHLCVTLAVCCMRSDLWAKTMNIAHVLCRKSDGAEMRVYIISESLEHLHNVHSDEPYVLVIYVIGLCFSHVGWFFLSLLLLFLLYFRSLFYFLFGSDGFCRSCIIFFLFCFPLFILLDLGNFNFPQAKAICFFRISSKSLNVPTLTFLKFHFRSQLFTCTPLNQCQWDVCCCRAHAFKIIIYFLCVSNKRHSLLFLSLSISGVQQNICMYSGILVIYLSMTKCIRLWIQNKGSAFIWKLYDNQKKWDFAVVVTKSGGIAVKRASKPEIE